MNVFRIAVEELSADSIAQLTAASPFSSPDFAEVWRAMGGRPVCWIVEAGGDCVAMLTAVEFGSSPLMRLQCMPDGLPGRIVMSAQVAGNYSLVAQTLFDTLRSSGYTRIFITDYDTHVTVPEGFETEVCETTVVDIGAPGWAPPDSKLRSEIRKAAREGVRPQPFVMSRDLDSFISLTRATEQRHNSPARYSDDFYARLAVLAGRDERVLWTVVRDNDRLAASHIYFCDGSAALYWQSCLDKEFSSMKPNQALMSDAIAKLRLSGVVRLNLGQSPSEAEGLESFKRKWGGITYRYPCYVYRSLLGRLR